MPVNSNDQELNKSFSDNIQTYNPYDLFSTSAIEDELTFCLSSKCDFQIEIKTNRIYIKTNRIYIKRKYLDYAERFLYTINLYKPIPVFEISLSDIPNKLEQALSSLNKRDVGTIFTNVVRRILESVDPFYYHANSIHGKVKWQIID